MDYLREVPVILGGMLLFVIVVTLPFWVIYFADALRFHK